MTEKKTACVPTYLPTCLPTYLPAYLPNLLTCDFKNYLPNERVTAKKKRKKKPTYRPAKNYLMTVKALPTYLICAAKYCLPTYLPAYIK